MPTAGMEPIYHLVGLEYDYFFQRLIMKVIQIILRCHILYIWHLIPNLKKHKMLGKKNLKTQYIYIYIYIFIY